MLRCFGPSLAAAAPASRTSAPSGASKVRSSFPAHVRFAIMTSSLRAGRGLAHEAVVEGLLEIDLGALELGIERRQQPIGVLHAVLGDDAGLGIHLPRGRDGAPIERAVAEVV